MSTLTSTTAPVIGDSLDQRIADRSLFGSYMQLTKARLSALVLLTTAVGFILGTPGDIDWMALIFTTIGTALAAGCASSFNQIWEVNLDRRMMRTRRRPLPANDLSMRHALVAALAMGAIGVATLAAFVNWIAAALALLTIVLYVLAYTPLKVRSTLNTMVGAVCGAIPPMIGWVAAAGSFDRGAWALALLLFVWQIPHFLALAWLYREDYRRGGFAMLPVIDRDGSITCRVVVLTAALLLPLGLLTTILRVSGQWCAIGSLILGLWLTGLCLRLYFSRTDSNARGVFLASIAYLPLLMCLMVLDRV
jgi:protoheme IX farnesyltransferase